MFSSCGNVTVSVSVYLGRNDAVNCLLPTRTLNHDVIRAIYTGENKTRLI